MVPRALTDLRANGRVALIGFPYDHNSSFMRGAAQAPSLIRIALRSDVSNSWSESGIDVGAIVLLDVGDVVGRRLIRSPKRAAQQKASPRRNREVFSRIERSISDLVDKGIRPISLGGDHSITYPILKALTRKLGKVSVVQFDAHPDLYDEYHGNRYSHACPFARVMEEGLVERLIQVGIRTMNGDQRRQARKFGVEVIEMKDLPDQLPCDSDSPFYISFDVDALDPAFAPGVSHREPGGLSTRQAIDYIHRIRAEVVGGDIVEFNPSMDPLNLTATVCAKLVKELAAKMLCDPSKGLFLR